MKAILISIFLFLINTTNAQTYSIPDSIKADGFYVELTPAAKASNFSLQFGNSSFKWYRNFKGAGVFAKVKNSIQVYKNIVGKQKNNNNFGLLEFSQMHYSWKSNKAYISILKESNQLHYSFYVADSGAMQWKYTATLTALDTINSF